MTEPNQELELPDGPIPIKKADIRTNSKEVIDVIRSVSHRELDEILEKFYRKVFEHAMALGQEFPKDNPKKMFDPCNAPDQEKAKKALLSWKDKEVERVIGNLPQRMRNIGEDVYIVVEHKEYSKGYDGKSYVRGFNDCLEQIKMLERQRLGEK